jgi:hypothetical protein
LILVYDNKKECAFTVQQIKILLKKYALIIEIKMCTKKNKIKMWQCTNINIING